MALTHLKTNNATIASRITLPDTIYDLINCNPFHSFVKVLARNLVMWDSITISADFVKNCLPPIVSFIYEQDYSAVYDRFQINTNFADFDYQNLSLVYHYGRAGAFLSLALKFSGTGDEKLKELLFAEIRAVEATQILENVFVCNKSARNSLDFYSKHQVLCSLCLSLGIVMAGLCDVESFKMLSEVRTRYRRQKQTVGAYGFNMAFEMAIGFVFLGNGSLTFGNENFQVACLLISVYPVFPADFNDNKFHLQALRHLYVLSIEENLFNLIDVETGRTLQLPVEVESLDFLGNPMVKTQITPLFLRSTGKWTRIRVLDEEFHKLDFRFDGPAKKTPRFLFVKRKFAFDFDFRKLQEIIFLQTKPGQLSTLPSSSTGTDLSNLNQKSKEILPPPLKFSSYLLGLLSTMANHDVYFLSALYSALKTDKGGLFPMISEHFLNKYPHVFTFKTKQCDAIQASVIRGFESLLRSKNKHKRAADLYINHWDEATENYLGEAAFDSLVNSKVPEAQRLLLAYTKLDFPVFLRWLLTQEITPSELEAFFYFLYNKGISSGEQLKLGRRILNTSSSIHKKNVLKRVFGSMTIKADETLISLLEQPLN